MRIKPLIVLLPLLVGCVIFSSNEEDVQEELDINRALWNAAAIHDYSMSFQRLCLFCSVEFLIPVRITVRGDTIYEVTDLDTGAPVAEPAPGAFLTIEGVFDAIQGAIDQRAAEIDVSYNSMFGYPTDVSIDPSRSLFNDDTQFQIREFVELN
ncbi:MAG: hypothetical protein IIB35_02080 [Gemmatimonadetes bacterium]|nr:hypothetical protein [Gemmatimonadota bacterium]